MERDILVRSSRRRPKRFALDRKRQIRKTQHQRGSVVFIVLFSTLIISYLAHRLVTTATAHARLANILADGIQYQQSMLQELQRPAPGPRNCTTQSLPHAGGEQPWHICSIGAPTFTANQDVALPSGKIDYNAIFAKAIQCSFRRSSQALAICTSPVAAMTCHLPSSLDGNMVTTDNIEADTVLFSPLPSGHVTTIATVGSLKIADALILSNSAIILAGGDTSIARILTNSPGPITVTIVSAHGDIQVASLGSNVSVLALGRRLVVAPPGPPTTRFVLPSFIPPPVSGIRPVGAG